MIDIIKNGIIQLDHIYGVPFKVDLIPITNKTARPANIMIPEYITVHNTGNSKKTADAEMHTKYVDTVTGYISWHFTVDDKQIFQELPISENAWHAGDGSNGTGNRKSIGIEICENEGIDWERAKENAVKLIVFLINNISTLKINPVKPHQYWSGKYCPRKILDEGWDKFINQINQYDGSDEIMVANSYITKKIITTNTLNIRPLPNTQKNPVGTLKMNDVIVITGEINEWYRISFNGKDAYIHSGYTKDYVENDEKYDVLKKEYDELKVNYTSSLQEAVMLKTDLKLLNDKISNIITILGN